jgi:hypothetical protein
MTWTWLCHRVVHVAQPCHMATCPPPALMMPYHVDVVPRPCQLTKSCSQSIGLKWHWNNVWDLIGCSESLGTDTWTSLGTASGLYSICMDCSEFLNLLFPCRGRFWVCCTQGIFNGNVSNELKIVNSGIILHMLDNPCSGIDSQYSLLCISTGNLDDWNGYLTVLKASPRRPGGGPTPRRPEVFKSISRVESTRYRLGDWSIS